jgi:hypothetical protein
LRRLLLPSCREMTRLTSRAMDTPPNAAQHLGMLLHLALCTVCRRYRRQLNWLRKVAGATPTSPASLATVRLQPEVRERLKARLRTAARNSGPHGGAR